MFPTGFIRVCSLGIRKVIDKKLIIFLQITHRDNIIFNNRKTIPSFRGVGAKKNRSEGVYIFSHLGEKKIWLGRRPNLYIVATPLPSFLKLILNESLLFVF